MNRLVLFWCVYAIVLAMFYTAANASAGTDDFWLMETTLIVVIVAGIVAGLVTWRKVR